MSSNTIRLMSTAHCSACESALDLLFSMPELRGYALRVVEVANDEDLVERYGERLPVLVVEEHELGWPFGAADLRDWLKSVSRQNAGGRGG